MNPENPDRSEVDELRSRLAAAEQTVKTLRESEARFREMAESVGDAFFVRDPGRSRPVYVSPAYERIWGRSLESIYADLLSWMEAVHPDDRGRVSTAIEAARETGKFEEEYRIIRPDGDVRWVSSRSIPVRDETGELKWVIGIARDITERTRADETQTLLASIVESSEDSIIGTNLDGAILSWNKSSERLYGYTAGEALGKHISLLFLPDLRKDSGNVLERLKRDGRVDRYEAVRVRKDGTQIDVSVILSPIKDAFGRLQGASGIYRDITAQKRADEEMRKAKEAAEAANRAKSEFLANISHEIRTPMNGIIAMTEVVLDSELTEEQREYLSIVRTSAESLLTIINDILDFSKIEARKLDLERKHFDLRSHIDAMIKSLAVRTEEKNLELVIDIRPEVPEVVVGDPTRLRQVLVNLVGNAIKFTDAGRVVVSVRPSPEGVHFSVSDTGVGIPADKQGIIFDAFAQADNSVTRKFGGTGLGLTITARLVEMMGGRIWLESSEGAGSTFHFTACLSS